MDIGCVYLNKKRKSREEMKKELAVVGHDKHGRQFLKESLFFYFCETQKLLGTFHVDLIASTYSCY